MEGGYVVEVLVTPPALAYENKEDYVCSVNSGPICINFYPVCVGDCPIDMAH